MADEIDAPSIVPAIQAAVRGHPEELAAIYRSDRPLTRRDRNLLALYEEGEFDRGRGRPRFSGQLTEETMSMVLAVKHVIRRKAELRQAGHKYRYHDAAIDDVTADFGSRGWAMPDRDKLENELRRSAKHSRYKTLAKNP